MWFLVSIAVSVAILEGILDVSKYGTLTKKLTLLDFITYLVKIKAFLYDQYDRK